VSRAGVLALVAWLLLVTACAWAISRVTISTDLQAFLPEAPSPAQQVLVDQLRDGVVSRLILVALEGASQDSLAELSRNIGQRLAGDSAFTHVNNGSEDLLQNDSAFLIEHRYVLSPAVKEGHFSERSLRASLDSQLELLASPLGAITGRLVGRDPTGEFLTIVDKFESRPRPQIHDGVWFSADGKHALLIGQTVAPGFDINAQEAALARIASAFDDAATALGIVGASLITVGPGVFAVETRDKIKSDAMIVTSVAALAIAALLMFVLRSTRALILVMVPVISGGFAGIAAVAIAFGTVHGITIGFGATLIGESVDYAIHLLIASERGIARDSAMARIWPTLRLGVLTSIVGSAALLLSGFPGLAQLGLFSIAGLIVALAVTRWVVPLLMPAEFSVSLVTAWGPRLQWWVQRAHMARIPSVLVVLLCVVWLVFKGGALWNDEFESLSPVPEEDQTLDGEIRRELGAPDVRKLIVVHGVDQEATLQVAESVGRILEPLVEAGVLGGFDSPAAYLPSQRTQRARQEAIPDEPVLRAALARAAAGLPFKADVFDDFIEQTQLARTGGLLDRADLQSTAFASQVDSLLLERRGAWYAMLPLLDVAVPGDVEAALSGFDPQLVMLVDLKTETDALYRGYRIQILTFAIIGTVAIIMLLLAALRSMRRCVQVVLPIAAAIAVTVAILAVAGVELTMFHLIALLLVVGVGSNYTLFFDRAVQQGVGRERTLVSLATCNLSTVLGFGLIGFASTPVLTAIGVTVSVGAALSLFFGAVFMQREETRANTPATDRSAIS
jgi:predicted exporter